MNETNQELGKRDPLSAAIAKIHQALDDLAIVLAEPGDMHRHSIGDIKAERGMVRHCLRRLEYIRKTERDRS